jgi:hypothetical protein
MQALETQTSVEINFSPLQRRYTLEEFWALPEREDHARYNLIGGYLFMVPPPNPPHGDVASRMMKSLQQFVFINNIAGDVHFPPEPIYVRGEGSTYLEPDMMYVSKELRQTMGAKRTSATSSSNFCLEARPSTIGPRRPTPIWLSACVSCGWLIRSPRLSKYATQAKSVKDSSGKAGDTRADFRPSRASLKVGKFQLTTCLQD